MNFEQAKEVASVINGTSDQIVNIGIIAITGAVAFLLKYGSGIAGRAKFFISAGIALGAASAICSYIGKGFLITIMLEFAGANSASTSKAPVPTIDFDTISMMAFFQFTAQILALIALGIGVFFSRHHVFNIETAATKALGGTQPKP